MQSNTRGPAYAQYFREDRAVRGGSWSDNAYNLRSADRSYSAPVNAFFIIGFRCVRGL